MPMTTANLQELVAIAMILVSQITQRCYLISLSLEKIEILTRPSRPSLSGELVTPRSTKPSFFKRAIACKFFPKGDRFIWLT